MMKEPKLSTPVPVERAEFGIGVGDSAMLIGSCFTENMGGRFVELGFPTRVNPFGILYNPLSMAVALSYCMDNRRVEEESLVFHDGLWHSWLHHGVFSRHDKQECLEACNQAVDDAHEFLHTCKTLIVTFGSAWYYILKRNGSVVANCHKVPAAQFGKRIATVDEVVSAWTPLLKRLSELGIRVVFTVSPVRHGAYGAHGNQLGKAVLLLAIEEMMRSESTVTAPWLSYFPAYEIVMDELRDYRFYTDDLLHPSSLAERIIWQRFQHTYMNDETIKFCEEKENLNKRMAHRELH